MGDASRGVKRLFLLIFGGSGFGQLTASRERDVPGGSQVDGLAEKVERSKSRIHLCRIDK